MQIRDVSLESDGIPITGQLYLPDGEPPYISVCICHGIPSGKPRDPADGGYPALAERICAQGFAPFIFNFRGCGSSGGNLDMSGWTGDLSTAIDYLDSVPEIKKRRIALLGFSGGAAVCIYTAADDDRVSSVAACASPADFADLLSSEPSQVIEHFRSIGAIRDASFPPSTEEWMQNFEKVTPLRYVAKLAPRPLLLVHGLRDETVNISHAYRLYSLAREPKHLSIIDGAGHRLRNSEEAVAAVIDWLKYLYLEPDTGGGEDYIDPDLDAGL